MATLARQTAANAVATSSILIGGMLSTIIVARLLGRENLGVFSYGMWLVGITLLVADLGVPGALARYLPELRRRGDGVAADGLERYLFVRYALVIAATVLGLVGVAATLLSEHFRFEPIGHANYLTNALFWLLVAGACAGQGAANFMVGLLRGRQEFGRMARIMLATAIVQIIATTIGAQFLGIAGALAGAILVGLCPTVLVISTLRRASPVAPDLRARIVRYCSATWASYFLASIISTRTEIFFLERSWGSSEVALFSICVTLSNLAVQAPLMLTGSLLPHLAQQVSAGEHARAAALYRTGMRLLAMVVIPACLGTAAIAPALIPLIYGAQFADAALPAAILVGSSAIGAVTSLAHIYMNACERNSFSVGVGAAGALGVVLAGFMIVPIYGVLGAAVARACVQICSAAILITYVGRSLNASAPLAELARIVAASLVCAAAAHAVIRAVPGPTGVALAIAAGVLSYTCALKLVGGITRSDLALISDKIAILPRPLNHIMIKVANFYVSWPRKYNRSSL